MKLALIIVAIVIAIVVVVLVIGALLPRDHVVSRSIVLHRSPGEVYQILRDFNAAPTWRSDVERMEMIPTADNHVRFREYAKHGAVTYDLVEDQPGERMVTRIADLNLGYSGSWTYTLTKTPTVPGSKSRRRARFQMCSSGSCRVSFSGKAARSRNTLSRSERNSVKPLPPSLN